MTGRRWGIHPTNRFSLTTEEQEKAGDEEKEKKKKSLQENVIRVRVCSPLMEAVCLHWSAFRLILCVFLQDSGVKSPSHRSLLFFWVDTETISSSPAPLHTDTPRRHITNILNHFPACSLTACTLVLLPLKPLQVISYFIWSGCDHKNLRPSCFTEQGTCSDKQTKHQHEFRLLMAYLLIFKMIDCHWEALFSRNVLNDESQLFSALTACSCSELRCSQEVNHLQLQDNTHTHTQGEKYRKHRQKIKSIQRNKDKEIRRWRFKMLCIV